MDEQGGQYQQQLLEAEVADELDEPEQLVLLLDELDDFQQPLLMGHEGNEWLEQLQFLLLEMLSEEDEQGHDLLIPQ